MAKTKISQYDATAANNTDIDSINIAEGMAPSNVNNAIRELMAHLKDMDAGTQALTSPQLTSADINGGTIDGVTIGGASAGAGTFTNLTATGLTVDNGVSSSIRIAGNGNNALNTQYGTLEFYNNDASTAGPNIAASIKVLSAQSTGSGANMVLGTTTGSEAEGTPALNRLMVGSNGDISFYEDTGTTPKFFWDASAESLGIGTTSPQRAITVSGSQPFIQMDNTATGGEKWELFSGTNALHGVPDGTFVIRNHEGAGNVLHIDSSGNVGIGTSSPTLTNGTGIHIANSGGASRIHLTSNTGETSSDGTEIGHNGLDAFFVNREAGNTLFYTSNAEAMRIDSSGNVLVGNTNRDTIVSNGAEGAAIGSDGFIGASRINGTVAVLNREDSDGSILSFRKDGTTVGSIGVNSGNNLYISSSDGDHAGLEFSFNSVIPQRGGTAADNIVDLGASSLRFDDVYATNGTIQTSDRNEKQDIAELTDAEQRVAVAAKGLLRKFRWRDAVEAKGDEARTHFGIIAQDLQAAFAAEGLDAGDYAMFISSTWTDEETGEERTRMGVRYNELLAFIIAAI